ncbi:MAG: response regulator [Armatimonadota bacterium]|nr:response regulator [Armatimonadota bacterium]
MNDHHEDDGILLIEDDPFVQEVVSHHLKNQGYEVWVAADPEAARGIMDRHGDHVKLLVVDSGLPVQSGESIADELKARFEKTRVLLISGYPRPVEPSEEMYPFLQKPFSGAELVERVNELMAT